MSSNLTFLSSLSTYSGFIIVSSLTLRDPDRNALNVGSSLSVLVDGELYGLGEV